MNFQLKYFYEFPVQFCIDSHHHLTKKETPTKFQDTEEIHFDSIILTASSDLFGSG